MSLSHDSVLHWVKEWFDEKERALPGFTYVAVASGLSCFFAPTFERSIGAPPGTSWIVPIFWWLFMFIFWRNEFGEAISDIRVDPVEGRGQTGDKDD